MNNEEKDETKDYLNDYQNKFHLKASHAISWETYCQMEDQGCT